MCKSCNAIYIGKTRRHYLVRVFEHLGISLQTHEKFTYNPNNGNNSAILNHVNGHSCTGKEQNFKIIGSASNDYHLCLKESLLIQKHKPGINTSDNSIPLKLFQFLSFQTFIFLFSFFRFFLVKIQMSYLTFYCTFLR